MRANDPDTGGLWNGKDTVAEKSDKMRASGKIERGAPQESERARLRVR
jgi:hypothetical protein